MKRTFTFLIILLSYLDVSAQTQPKGFHLDRPINMGAILSSRPSLALGFSTISEARTIINDIMSVVGQQQNFQVVSTTQVDNAAAVIYQNQRYILYNPSFINKLDDVANDRWASISVVAHEIGHHLLGHTLDGTGSQIPKELRADEFSGLVLHKMGATLQQAQLAMQLISSPYASATHPGKNDRLTAISKGWNSTTEQSNSNNDVAIDYPSENKRSNNSGREYPESDSRGNYPSNDRRSYPQSDRRSSYPNQYPNQRNSYPQRGGNNYPGYPNRRSDNANNATIIYRVNFRSANGQQYFITSQNNVVRYTGNRLQLVAKIASTNRANYPYVIYDDQQQLYVDRRGNIYTDNGRNVGYITPHA